MGLLGLVWGVLGFVKRAGEGGVHPGRTLLWVEERLVVLGLVFGVSVDRFLLEERLGVVWAARPAFEVVPVKLLLLGYLTPAAACGHTSGWVAVVAIVEERAHVISSAAAATATERGIAAAVKFAAIGTRHRGGRGREALIHHIGNELFELLEHRFLLTVDIEEDQALLEIFTIAARIVTAVVRDVVRE